MLSVLYSICSNCFVFYYSSLFLVVYLENPNVRAGPDLIQISNECFSAEWDLHRELERAASRTAADTEVDETIACLHAKKLVSFCKMLIIVVTDY